MAKSSRKSIWDTQPAGNPDTLVQDQGWSSQAESKVVQNPVTPAVPIVEQLRLTEKKQRNRTWESQAENRTMLFRRVPPGLHKAVKEVAESLHVRVDDVARAFLEFGLLSYQKGSIQIQPVLNDGRLTLFPNSDNRAKKNLLPGWYERVWEQQPPARQAHKTRHAPGEHDKPWKWQVAYRSIPIELQTDLRQIHREKSVPLGEVATMFLGYSLEAYQAGRLVLNPQPHHSTDHLIDRK